MNPYDELADEPFATELSDSEALEWEQRTECEQILLLRGFVRGSHQLTPNHRERLRRFLGDFIQDPPSAGAELHVVGHADDAGDPAANRTLGLRRALEVRRLIGAAFRRSNVTLPLRIRSGSDAGADVASETTPEDPPPDPTPIEDPLPHSQPFDAPSSEGENRHVELLLCPAAPGQPAAWAPVGGVSYGPSWGYDRPYWAWWRRRFPSQWWRRARRVPSWSRRPWIRTPIRRVSWRPAARVRSWSRVPVRRPTQWPSRRPSPPYRPRPWAASSRPVRSPSSPWRREMDDQVAGEMDNMPLEMLGQNALEQERGFLDLAAWPDAAEGELESTSQCDCRIGAPSKGHFSKPTKDGHAWYTPARGDYGEKLARCVAIKNNAAEGRMIHPSAADVQAVWRKIKNHPCNQKRLAGKWFLPRFKRDRCTPGGLYYGAIYIPLNVSDGVGDIVGGLSCG